MIGGVPFVLQLDRLIVAVVQDLLALPSGGPFLEELQTRFD